MSRAEAALPLQIEQFMGRPEALQRTLEKRGALEFQPFNSGLFPAAYLSPQMAEQTGMDRAWLRDNAQHGMALYENGRRSLGIGAGRAMLTVLDDHRRILDEVVHDHSERRLPVRVNGTTLKSADETRVQHDSTGYLMWFTSRLLLDGALPKSPEELQKDLGNLAQTAHYLKTIEYWQDADAGHWEEDHLIHAASIGTVVAGLRDTLKLFAQVRYGSTMLSMTFLELIENGKHALSNMLARGITNEPPRGAPVTSPVQPWPDNFQPPQPTADYLNNFNLQRRRHDAALLFLIEPLHVLEDEQAAMAVDGVTRHLLRKRGIARYEGDTYWGPDFKEVLLPSERTTSAAGRLELRNQRAAGIAYTQTEAQWTIFDGPLAEYYAKQHLKTGSREALTKYFEYAGRSLGQLALLRGGKLRWPEARYYEYHPIFKTYRLVPNDHLSLLWPQSLALRWLKYFPQLAHTSRT